MLPWFVETLQHVPDRELRNLCLRQSGASVCDKTNMTKNRSFGGYRSAAVREGEEKGEGAREGEPHGRSAAAREGKENARGRRKHFAPPQGLAHARQRF